MSDATVETTVETLTAILDQEVEKLNALRISLAEVKKGVRSLFEDNLDEESEEIHISLEDANEFLASQGLRELEIEREYDVRGTVSFSFIMTITATSEEKAREQAENAHISLDCYDADAMDYDFDSMDVNHVERADLS